MLKGLGLTLICAICAMSSNAWSQDASSTKPLGEDRLRSAGGYDLVERDGFQLTDTLLLHPKASIEGGFTTNIFSLETGAVSAPLIRFIAAIDIATSDQQAGEEEAAPENYRLSTGAVVSWTQYVSDRESVTQQSFLGADVVAGLVLFPDDDFSLRIDENFARAVQSTNFISTRILARNQNSFGVQARYQPEASTLGASIGYRNLIDDFASQTTDFASRIQHSLQAQLEWEFLPFSKLTLDSSYGFYGPLTQSGFKQSSNPLRIRLGASTPITESIYVAGQIGYGHASYEAGAGFSNVIGGLTGRYHYSLAGHVSLGYKWGFQDSINSNYFAEHQATLLWKHQYERFIFETNLSLFARSYQGVPASIGPPTRNDIILVARLKAHYLIRDWLAASARFDATSVNTDYRYNSGGMVDDPSFSRLDFILGLSASY